VGVKNEGKKAKRTGWLKVPMSEMGKKEVKDKVAYLDLSWVEREAQKKYGAGGTPVRGIGKRRGIVGIVEKGIWVSTTLTSL